MFVAVMGYGTVGSGGVEVCNKIHNIFVMRRTLYAVVVIFLRDMG